MLFPPIWEFRNTWNSSAPGTGGSITPLFPPVAPVVVTVIN